MMINYHSSRKGGNYDERQSFRDIDIYAFGPAWFVVMGANASHRTQLSKFGCRNEHAAEALVELLFS